VIAAGADIRHCDDAGCTALHTAIHCSHLPVTKLLLGRGADAVLNTMQCSLCACCDQVSALMMCRDTAILKLLLTAGADVYAVTSSGNYLFTHSSKAQLLSTSSMLTDQSWC
jgi:ankyrin repeat protein